MQSRFRQAIPRIAIFGRNMAEFNTGVLYPVLPLPPPVERPENLLLSSSIAEILGRLSLDEKQDGVGRGRPAHRFDPAHTVST
jgi:hypothetical protein